MDEPTKPPSPQPEDNNNRSQPVVNDITPPPAASVKSDPITVRVESSEDPKNEAATGDDTPDFIETDKSSETSPVPADEPAVEQPDMDQQEGTPQPESENISAESDSSTESLAKPPEESDDTPASKAPEPSQESSDENTGHTPPVDNTTQGVTESSPPAPSNESTSKDQELKKDTGPAMEMGVSASQSKKSNPNRNNRTFAIVSVIVIALLLSGAAIFVYLTTDNNAQQADTLSAVDDSSSSVTSPAPSSVDSGDIDSLLLEIDNGLQSMDDFDREAFSDDSIGL